MNIETLLYSLIVAAVSGLTFVAYRHPNGYRKIFSALVPVASMAMLSVVGWNLGALGSSIQSVGKALKNNPEEKIQSSSFSITSMNESFDYIIIAVVVGFFIIGYLFFLYKLPTILEANQNEKDT
jgi:hypothetical protein